MDGNLLRLQNGGRRYICGTLQYYYLLSWSNKIMAIFPGDWNHTCSTVDHSASGGTIQTRNYSRKRSNKKQEGI